MDEELITYANAATAYGSRVEELRLLSQSRHTRSAYLGALELLEKARQACEQAHVAFHEPPEPRRRAAGR